MSMYWAGYSGIALVLSADVFEGFVSRYAEKHGIDVDNLSETLECDGELMEYEFIPSMTKTGKPFYVIPVTPDFADGTDLVTFMPEGKTYEERSVSFRNECVYAVFAENQLCDVKSLTAPLYNSYDELVREFKDELEGYLPDNFDWDAHIGILEYAAFC